MRKYKYVVVETNGDCFGPFFNLMRAEEFAENLRRQNPEQSYIVRDLMPTTGWTFSVK